LLSGHVVGGDEVNAAGRLVGLPRAPMCSPSGGVRGGQGQRWGTRGTKQVVREVCRCGCGGQQKCGTEWPMWGTCVGGEVGNCRPGTMLVCKCVGVGMWDPVNVNVWKGSVVCWESVAGVVCGKAWRDADNSPFCSPPPPVLCVHSVQRCVVLKVCVWGM